MGIPDGYTQATKEEIAKHFPVNQPNNMLINRSTNSYITFTITGAELQPSMVESKLAQYYNAYKRTVGGFQSGEIAKKDTKKSVIGAFQYLSTTLDRDLFNIFVLTSMQGKELIITMHCDQRSVSSEGLKLMNSISSIEVM